MRNRLLILYYLFPLDSFLFRDETVQLLYIIGTNEVLYTLVSYFFLLALSKNHSKAQVKLPPSPND